MNHSRLVILLVFVSVFFSGNPIGAAQEGVAVETPAYEMKYFLKIEKLNSFLDFPTGEKLELFRRLGYKLGELSAWFENGVLLCGGFVPAKDGQHPKSARDGTLLEGVPAGEKMESPFVAPTSARDWDPSQKDQYQRLLQRGEGYLASIAGDIQAPPKGLVVKGVFDPAVMGKYLEKFLPQAPEASLGEKSRKLKLQNEIMPMFEMIDLVALVATLDEKNFNLRCDIFGKPEFAEAFKAFGSEKDLIACGRYADPESLFTLAHFQPPTDVKKIVEELDRFPQTLILKAYLASAGLDLEKDLLPMATNEYMVVGNLVPVGERGLPDLRLIARVKDLSKFLGVLPNLKNLASNLGIFAQVLTEEVVMVKVSYFMAPAYAVFVSLIDDLMVLTTGKEKLVETARRIADVKAGKIQPFSLPPGLSRYWRIRFKDLNEQLQRFLQSPLMAGQGIPPITNLTITKELGDLEMLSKVTGSRIEIRVKMPIIAQP